MMMMMMMTVKLRGGGGWGRGRRLLCTKGVRCDQFLLKMTKWISWDGLIPIFLLDLFWEKMDPEQFFHNSASHKIHYSHKLQGLLVPLGSWPQNYCSDDLCGILVLSFGPMPVGRPWAKGPGYWICCTFAAINFQRTVACNSPWAAQGFTATYLRCWGTPHCLCQSARERKK